MNRPGRPTRGGALLACAVPLLLLVACDRQTAADGLPADLTDTTWQLVEMRSMDDSVHRPVPPDGFQLTLTADGRVAVRADCNRGQGTWTFEAPSGLQFGPLASTRMACPPESLHDRFLQNLEFVRSFVIEDERLYLATLADGAILEFQPVIRNPEG